jgi:hypothetical protein
LAPFGQAVSEEKIFFSVANQKKELLLLKLLGQIKLNLAGSIYARSSIKHLHLVPFGQQIWPPRAILFSDFNSSQSEKRIALGGHVYWPNGTK